MEQKLVSGVTGAEIYGIISVCIFVAFFAVMILWTASRNKTYLKHMEDLPLDGDEANTIDNNQPESK